MKLAKLSLIASAIGFAGFGLALFIAPSLLENAGVTTMSPAGTIELRAFYGGIEIGLAVFFLLALRHKEWTHPALVVQVAVTGAIVFYRVVALIIDNFNANTTIYLSLAAEAALLILGIVALAFLHRTR